MVVIFDALGFETSAANMVSTPAPFDACAIAGSNTIAGSATSR